MKLSKKKAPVSNDAQLDRVFRQVYDDINEIINAVNSSQTTSEEKPFAGKEGDIKLVRLSDGTYEIQGRAHEGWVSTAMTYKEK